MASHSPSSIKGKALEEVLLSLVERDAVELAPLPSPGFYSRMFVVWKTSGSWRPVIDLCPEPLHWQDTIQDGNHSIGSSFGASGRLDGLPRPERSILSGSCTSGQLQTLEVRSLWQALLVLGFLFRPLHSSPSLHQGYGSSFDFSSQSGHLAPPLLGRLAHSSSLSGGGSPVLGDRSFSLPRAGHSGQPGEVQLHSFSMGSVPGDDPRLCSFQGFSFPSSREASLNRRRVLVLQASARVLLAGSPGDSYLPLPSSSGRSSPHAVPSADPPPLLGPSGQISSCPLRQSVSSRSLLVARSCLPPGGSFAGPSLPRP